MVSCSEDNTILQWDTLNYIQFKESLIGHESYVMGVQYSENAIISCSWDQTIRVWNQKTGKECIDRRIHHLTTIWCLSLSPISSQVAFGDYQGMVIIWDYDKHRLKHQSLKGHNQTINSIQYSIDGKLLLSGSDDNKIIIWDVLTFIQITIFEGHSSYVKSVNFSPDQKYIIYGGDDYTIRLWNLETGMQTNQILSYDNVRSTQFSLCGNYIITGGDDKQIMVRPHEL